MYSALPKVDKVHRDESVTDLAAPTVVLSGAHSWTELEINPGRRLQVYVHL